MAIATTAISGFVKKPLDEGLTVKEFARRDQDQKERFRPGYVDGKEEVYGPAVRRDLFL